MRWVVGVFFVLHGLGHCMGFLAAWTKVDVGFTDASWLLPSEQTVRGPIGRIWGLLWLVALAGWVAVGISVLSGATGWETRAMGSAAVSLVAIVPWWNAVPTGAKLGALVDVIVLGGLLTPWGKDLADRLS